MDEIDKANEYAQGLIDHAITKHKAQAKDIPKGVPGDCEYCGEWSGRLVGRACAPCRDRYKLP